MLELQTKHDLALFADLLDYPIERTASAVESCRAACAGTAANEHLETFAQEIAALPLAALEEAYVRAFLVAPTAALYVGVHLFGEESFKRAHFMARLVERFEELGYSPGNELPDHLGVLLRFAERLGGEERRDLERWCLAVPVTAMHASLDSARNPYRHVLAAVLGIVAPAGVADEVRSRIVHVAASPDSGACMGCSIPHGGELS
jgi:nitrate reductase delta subunit